MLAVDHLTRRFGDHVAVDQINFEVPDGELVGFVGGNGAGKTTTMRMMMGVLGAHGGGVLLDGQPVTAADRRNFGYMPEERGLYPKQAIRDQLIYLGRLHGMESDAATRSTDELLERFTLTDRRKDALESLSLGNQQRVQIAAAVVSEPSALILDEPFSGLDPAAVDSMVELLHEHTARGIPILFSSHQLDVVERVCDRLVILAKGKVVAQGTAAELRGSAPLRHRLTVEGDVGWIRDLAGLDVLSVDGSSAVVRLETLTPNDLLQKAMGRGSVLELSELRRSVSEIYREVTA
ncbi:ABC transporter ATP-binding protein [Demetria terragena]|uniref:ABC transporter ATP-binding protein n=1 Tax=Demetria terragena TaxID=63959 RepID=UPI000363CE8F|nr:ATP-binding cassette domain-containing protein [Demetria terragena]